VITISTDATQWEKNPRYRPIPSAGQTRTELLRSRSKKKGRKKKEKIGSRRGGFEWDRMKKQSQRLSNPIRKINTFQHGGGRREDPSTLRGGDSKKKKT